MAKSVEDNDPKPCTVDDVLEWIVAKELAKRYHVAKSNCFFFANNLFAKFANEPYPIEPEELRYATESVNEAENSLATRFLRTLVKACKACGERVSPIRVCKLCPRRRVNRQVSDIQLQSDNYLANARMSEWSPNHLANAVID